MEVVMCLNPMLYDIFRKRIINYGDDMRYLANNDEYCIHHFDLYRKLTDTTRYIEVPCGKCLDCRREYSNVWSYRCTLESVGKPHCMITLTYKDNPINLSKYDVQCFLKRLRKDLGYSVKFKYFLSGEYGDKFGRPHYHLIIIGWCPDDLQYFFTTDAGNDVYLSEYVAKIWQAGSSPFNRGFISVELGGVKSTAYACNYLQKFSVMPLGATEPPFVLMSKGIGKEYFLDNVDSILATDKVYLEGYYKKTPRYFLKLAEKAGIDLSDLRANRIKKARLFNVDLKIYLKKIKKCIDFFEK